MSQSRDTALLGLSFVISHVLVWQISDFFLSERLHFEPSFFQNGISELDHTHFTPTSFPLLAKQKCMRVQPINIFPWKNLAAQSNSFLKCIGGIDDIFCRREVISIAEGMVNDGLGKWRREEGCLNVRYDDPLQANGQQRKRREGGMNGPSQHNNCRGTATIHRGALLVPTTQYCQIPIDADKQYNFWSNKQSWMDVSFIPARFTGKISNF